MKQLGLPTGAEEQYWTMKNQWQSFTPDQENRFAIKVERAKAPHQ